MSAHPLHDIFDKVPKIQCAGHCGRDRHNTCCGPIGCSHIEAQLLDEFDGIASPWTEPRSGHDYVLMDATQLTLYKCPHLTINGRCAAYEVRPMIADISRPASK